MRRRKLSIREEQILSLICEGWTAKEIAQMMELSPNTIYEVKRRLRLKTGCHRIVSMVMWAVQNRVVNPRKVSLCR